MFAAISCFSALYEANLFLNPADFMGRQPLYLYLGRKDQCVLGDQVMQSPLQLVIYVRTWDGSQGTGFRELAYQLFLIWPLFF